MKKLIQITLLIIGTISLTNFVFAQGEVAPTDTPKCQACSSGSPLMKGYMTMMSEVITALGSATNVNPGAIPAQGSNTDAQKSWSEERSNAVKDSKITITNQPAGIKSDMRSLDKIQERIADAGSSLINIKFQYDKQVETRVLSAVTSALNKQVGTDKLFIKQGSIDSSITYGGLLRSLNQLHQYTIQIPEAQSGYSFIWMGYESNPKIINQFVSYYACAQNIVTCNQNSSILQETANTIKGYRGDIVLSWREILRQTSKQYRTFNVAKDGKGRIINISDGYGEKLFEKEYSDNGTTSLFGGRISVGGNWKQGFKDLKAKRAAQQAQQQAQAEQVETIQATKQAVHKGGAVPIEQTNVGPIITNTDQPYKQGEISIMAAALNAANDQILSQRIETQRYNIGNDSTSIAYKIPKLTKQIHDTTQVVKVSANRVIAMCMEHCKNDARGYCGKPIE